MGGLEVACDRIRFDSALDHRTQTKLAGQFQRPPDRQRGVRMNSQTLPLLDNDGAQRKEGTGRRGTHPSPRVLLERIPDHGGSLRIIERLPHRGDLSHQRFGIVSAAGGIGRIKIPMHKRRRAQYQCRRIRRIRQRHHRTRARQNSHIRRGKTGSKTDTPQSQRRRRIRFQQRRGVVLRPHGRDWVDIAARGGVLGSVRHSHAPIAVHQGGVNRQPRSVDHLGIGGHGHRRAHCGNQPVP